jgi:hypothetical protein
MENPMDLNSGGKKMCIISLENKVKVIGVDFLKKFWP